MNATDSRKKTVAIPVLRDRILEARGRLHDSDAPRLGNPPDNYEDTTRFCPPRYDPEDRAQREADAKELERSGNKAKRENDSGVAKDDGSQTNKVNKTPKQKPEERRDKDTGTADHGKSTTKQKQDAKEKPTKGKSQNDRIASNFPFRRIFVPIYCPRWLSMSLAVQACLLDTRLFADSRFAGKA